MKIPVVFATDENYFFYTCVAITSLARSAASDTKYEVYILVGKQSSDIGLLDKMARRYPNIKLQIIEVGAKLFHDVVIHNDHITKTAFYRLLLCDLLDSERCIYLDSDVIITEDLQSLFTIELDGGLIAGCRDIWIDMLSDVECEKRRERTKIHSMDGYINSGVLVMDLGKLRAEGLDRLFIEHLRYDYPYEDQDIINVCCYGRIKHLPAKWNIFTLFLGELNRLRTNGISEEIIQDFQKKKGIIHYATPFMRPWEHFYCWATPEWWDVASEWKGEDVYQSLWKKVQNQEEQERWAYYLKRCQEYERIAIFGHTFYGEQICDWLLNSGIGKEILFCDNALEKQTKLYRGVRTFSLAELKIGDTLFINSSQRKSTEVMEILLEQGIKKDAIICYKHRQKEYYQYLDSRYYMDVLRDIFLREKGMGLEGYEDDLSSMRNKLREDGSYKTWQDKYHMGEWILKEG